jgi:hypothetical protein
MPSMDFPEITLTQAGGWWEAFGAAGGLSPDQSARMQDIINKLCKRDCELRMERGVIDKQIKQFYLNKLMIVPLIMSSSTPMEQLGIIDKRRSGRYNYIIILFD